MTAKSASGTPSGASTSQTPEPKSKYAQCLLYRKVLVQALKDAASRNDLRRLEIGAWVVSRRFVDICEWGGVKAPGMRQGFKQVLLAPEEDRKPRCDRLITILESAGSDKKIGS